MANFTCCAYALIVAFVFRYQRIARTLSDGSAERSFLITPTWIKVLWLLSVLLFCAAAYLLLQEYGTAGITSILLYTLVGVAIVDVLLEKPLNLVCLPIARRQIERFQNRVADEGYRMKCSREIIEEILPGLTDERDWDQSDEFIGHDKDEKEAALHGPSSLQSVPTALFMKSESRTAVDVSTPATLQSSTRPPSRLQRLKARFSRLNLPQRIAALAGGSAILWILVYPNVEVSYYFSEFSELAKLRETKFILDVGSMYKVKADPLVDVRLRGKMEDIWGRDAVASNIDKIRQNTYWVSEDVLFSQLIVKALVVGLMTLGAIKTFSRDSSA